MAADSADCTDPALALAVATSMPFAVSVAVTADALPDRDPAARAESFAGLRRFSGSLSRFDPVDTVQFSVDRTADIHLGLSGLKRDANLYLIDGSGKLIGRSQNAGRSAESIQTTLRAGDYSIAVVAAGFGTTPYRLSLSAELRPKADPTPAPASLAPPAAHLPAAPLPAELPRTERVVQPLADVAYFGGSREWNLNAIAAPEAWAAGYTGQGVVVAVIDTGVDLDHPDLIQNLYVNPGEIPGNAIDDDGNGFIDDVHGYDFVDRDAKPDDLNGHGTHVAGIIGASRNHFGATGIAPATSILPVRVLDRNGAGNDVQVAAGIRYAAQLGANIINLSLGGAYSFAIDAAIDFARSLGSLVVAAAGNESSSLPSYPGRFSATNDHVISVGAYSSSGRRASFSNSVGNSRSIQVDAPGVSIYSTYVGGRYASLSGTSMAAPHIAGLAALTLSANPSLTTRELRDLLSSGAVGRAVGSDALGSATALTTVAYAAAGLATAPPPTLDSGRASSANSTSLPRPGTLRTASNVEPWFTQPGPLGYLAGEEAIARLGEVSSFPVAWSDAAGPRHDGMRQPVPSSLHAQQTDAFFASAAESAAEMTLDSVLPEAIWMPLALASKVSLS